MKNKKFLALIFSISTILVSGCSPYSEYEKDYTMNSANESIAMELGEARYINLYNLKKPIELQIKAPKGKTIVYDNGEKALTHKLNIEPRNSISYSFLVEELSPKDPTKNPLEVLDFTLNTFKNVKVPSHATEIKERSGKYTYFKGWRLNYSVQPESGQIELDLNDFNTIDRHEFNFSGPVANIEIKFLAPLGSQFLYNNGTTAETHTIDLNTEKSVAKLNFDLFYKGSKTVFQKRIDINFKGLAPTHSPSSKPRP